MTFSANINADTKNVDMEIFCAFFAIVLIFVFWFAVCMVIFFRAKIVVAFHMLLHLLLKIGDGLSGVIGTRRTTFSIILCMLDEVAWTYVLMGC